MIWANVRLRVVLVNRLVRSLVYIQIMLQQKDNVQATLRVNQGGATLALVVSYFDNITNIFNLKLLAPLIDNFILKQLTLK